MTGSTDRQIRIFNPSSASSQNKNKQGPIQTYSAHGYEVLDLAVTEGNDKFISVGGDKTVFLWDVATAQTLRRWNGHAGRVNSCAWGGAEESVAVTGSYDSTVKMWDTKSRSERPLMTLTDAKDSISSVQVTGWEIVAGSVDGRVRTYDIRTGQMDADVIGHPVTSVSVAKTNDSYLVSTLDSTIRLMDKRDGKLLQAFRDPEVQLYEHARSSSLILHSSRTGTTGSDLRSLQQTVWSSQAARMAASLSGMS